MAVSGNGFTGLGEMFSLNAVERCMLEVCSTFTGNKGSVSDLFIRLRIKGTLGSLSGSFETLCFLFDAAGDGNRLENKKADGMRV